MAEIEEKISPGEERFERMRKTIGLFVGPAAMLLLFFLPMGGITSQAQKLAAILSLVVIWWISEPVPIPVTALIGTGLCVILGIDTMKKIFAPFGDPIIFLFIGSFIIAKAMTTHRLDKRLAINIISLPWVGKSSRRLLFVFGLIAVGISMWVSNTATTAMLFPIGVGILSAIAQIDKKEPTGMKFATAMMLMAAYGSSVGGIGTPVGTPPNLIGIGLIHQLLNIKITFFQWMIFAVPLVIIMYVLLFVLLNILFPAEYGKLEGIKGYIENEKKQLGKVSRGEKNVIIAFSVTVILWILPGIFAAISGSNSLPCKWFENHVPEGLAAIIGASILFLMPTNWKTRTFTITWKEAVMIDWGTIILFGGGLSLGSLMFSTGLAESIGKGIMALTGARTLFAITAVATALGILTSELTSNTASANMVIPIMISLSLAAKVNPLPPAIGACLGASYGFMLPVSTPPNAIVYGSGYIPIIRMIKAGIIFDVIGYLIIMAGVFLLLPLAGIH